MEEIKNRILSLWQSVNRSGISSLVDFLNNSDFFTAPCSIKHHLAKVGGLAEHSLHVYDLLYEKVSRYQQLNISKESIIICGLGHDLCKVNYYQEGGEPCSDAQYKFLSDLWNQKQGLIMEMNAGQFLKLFENGQFKRSIPGSQATILIDWLKNRPQEAFPELPITWSVKDQLPLGHGEKSMSVLQDFITLTDEEKMAIRWHMAAWDLSNYSGTWAFNDANKKTPLVTLLSTADFEASNIIEREEGDH